MWIGKEADKPKDIGLAFPREADWTNPNTEAYNESCWAKESELLMSLGGEFKTMGPKIKGVPKDKSESKTNKVTES